MTAYKIEIVVLDDEDVREDEVRALVENNRYLCISVHNLKKKDIPDWDDDHLLNLFDTTKEQIDAFFAEE